MNADVFAFRSSDGHPGHVRTAPQPEPGREPLPDREWGLSAGQVVAVVLAIVAASELIGMLF
jgi:hypothetical protein